MNRDKSKLEQRREYVKDFVNSHEGTTTKAVEILANNLFLSETTIWNDISYNYGNQD